jgi:hypothetical protein
MIALDDNIADAFRAPIIHIAKQYGIMRYRLYASQLIFSTVLDSDNVFVRAAATPK